MTQLEWLQANKQVYSKEHGVIHIAAIIEKNLYFKKGSVNQIIFDWEHEVNSGNLLPLNQAPTGKQLKYHKISDFKIIEKEIKDKKVIYKVVGELRENQDANRVRGDFGMSAKTASSIPTWRYLLELIRYKPLFYLTNGLLASGLYYFFLLIPGLIIRQIFDTITVKTAAGLNVWTLLALLVGSAIAQQTFLLIGVTADGVFRMYIATLLCKHLLTHIWERPAAQALPSSSGEAISRFRDDIAAVLDFLTFSFDPIAQGLAITIGLIILARINLLLALVVFAPLVVAIATINLASQRIRKYRQANQEAIGGVTGLLGEIFTAVQEFRLLAVRSLLWNTLRK